MLNRITEGDGGRPVLVCKPGATNITCKYHNTSRCVLSKCCFDGTKYYFVFVSFAALYMPLQKFMKDMENNISALVG